MGAPINTSQYEKSSDRPIHRKSSRVYLKYTIMFAAPLVLSVYLTIEFSSILPSLDPRIFETLIQVIGVLLGLTVAGMFYYLGKIDDQKYQYVISVVRELSIIMT